MRVDEPEDEETLGAVATLGGGWAVRARDERRGDIAKTTRAREGRVEARGGERRTSWASWGTR